MRVCLTAAARRIAGHQRLRDERHIPFGVLSRQAQAYLRQVHVNAGTPGRTCGHTRGKREPCLVYAAASFAAGPSRPEFIRARIVENVEEAEPESLAGNMPYGDRRIVVARHSPFAVVCRLSLVRAPHLQLVKDVTAKSRDVN
jgi:hypothetical protein